jgi:hypothetical protein
MDHQKYVAKNFLKQTADLNLLANGRTGGLLPRR